MNSDAGHPNASPLPLSVRIHPNRARLRAGALAGLTLAVLVALPGAPIAGLIGADTPALKALLVVAALLLAAGCGFRLIAMLPIIEASELGIAIWFHGPYRRPFFAPWSRVRAIVLTEVLSARGARQSALGLDFVKDTEFPAPPPAAGARAPAPRAAHADLAWPARSLSGDARQWVALLQKMQSAHGGRAEPAT